MLGITITRGFGVICRNREIQLLTNVDSGRIRYKWTNTVTGLPWQDNILRSSDLTYSILLNREEVLTWDSKLDSSDDEWRDFCSTLQLLYHDNYVNDVLSRV